jgi:hypothetical protein
LRKTRFLHERAQHDPLPALDRHHEFSPVFVLSERGPDPNPLAAPNGSHHYYPRSPSLALRALPPMNLLRTQWLEGDYPSTVSPSPRNPDRCTNNCLWVSLAQDKVYSVGLDSDLKFWGQCEPVPIRDADVPAVLQRCRGGSRRPRRAGPRVLVREPRRVGLACLQRA